MRKVVEFKLATASGVAILLLVASKTAQATSTEYWVNRSGTYTAAELGCTGQNEQTCEDVAAEDLENQEQNALCHNVATEGDSTIVQEEIDTWSGDGNGNYTLNVSYDILQDTSPSGGGGGGGHHTICGS